MVLCLFSSCPLETNDDLLLLCDLGPHLRLICLQLHKVEPDNAVKTRRKLLQRAPSALPLQPSMYVMSASVC